MVSATHTHSGPITADYLSNENDPVVPKTDQNYVKLMEDGIVEAACKAYESVRPARIGLAYADGSVAGTNRRSPEGPADPQVPVMLVQTKDGKTNIGCMVVVSMHPTVLHEDSKAVSGDFPGLARIYLQENVIGKDCPVIWHTGPSGNQSPRHVTKANTYDEVKRIGTELGKNIEKAINQISFTNPASISCRQSFVELPRRKFPAVADSEDKLKKAIDTLESLRKNNASRQHIRTAECDWFGAEETLTLAKAQAEGRLQQVYDTTMPAEIQTVKIGPWAFLGWQAEIFVEYALKLKKLFPNTFVISIANGELQGYIVTKKAALEGGYEASNGLFEWQSGMVLVEESAKLFTDW
jgi:hypothetical protein